MTDDKVKEAVGRLRAAPLTIVGTLCIPGDLTTLIADHDALQAERDKLSAEVDGWKAQYDKATARTAQYARDAISSEAKLTALVEACQPFSALWDQVSEDDRVRRAWRVKVTTTSDAIRNLLRALAKAPPTTPTIAPVEAWDPQCDGCGARFRTRWEKHEHQTRVHGAKSADALIQPQGEERS